MDRWGYARFWSYINWYSICRTGHTYSSYWWIVNNPSPSRPLCSIWCCFLPPRIWYTLLVCLKKCFTAVKNTCRWSFRAIKIKRWKRFLINLLNRWYELPKFEHRTWRTSTRVQIVFEIKGSNLWRIGTTSRVSHFVHERDVVEKKSWWKFAGDHDHVFRQIASSPTISAWSWTNKSFKSHGSW